MDCLFSRELGDEFGRILLPLLVVLAVTIPFVVLALGKRHATHLEYEEGREQWADEGQQQSGSQTTEASAQPKGSPDGLRGKHASRCCC